MDFINDIRVKNTRDTETLKSLLGNYSILDLECMSSRELRDILGLSMSYELSSFYSRQIKSKLFPKLKSLAEVKNETRTEINHIFPFKLYAGNLAEFDLYPECEILTVLQALMEQYLLEFDHKILFLDTTNSSYLLKTMYDIDVLQLNDLEALENAVSIVKSGNYGMVLLHSLDPLLDSSLPSFDLKSYGERAAKLVKIMSALKTCALRLNLFVIYTNEITVDFSKIKDEEVKLVIKLRGGNAINYAPHLRLQFEKGLKVTPIDSSYIPHQEYTLSLLTIDSIF